MGKFKVGQCVRRVSGSSFTTPAGRHSEGFIGQIKEVVAKGWDELIFTNGHRGIADGYEPWQPKIGDRVRMTKKVDGNITDCDATIIADDGTTVQPFVIKFDRKIEWAHTASGRTSSDRAYWVSAADIEPLLVAIVPLVIEAGKFYKTRDGRKVGPMVKAQWGYGPDWLWSVDHPFDASCGKAWRADGTFSTVADRPDPADLVAEWVDKPKSGNDNGATLGDILQAAIGKPVTVKISQSKFKVGDIVKRANGFQPHQRLRITKADGDRYSVEWIAGGPGSTDGWRGYEFELHSPAPTAIAIVCLIENGQPKPSDRPHVHADEARASKEAARLASVHKGKEFGVFVLTSIASQPAPVYAHEWQRLAIKGEKTGAIKELRAANDLTLKGAKDAVEHWLELNAA